tara:strand:- start:2960 stop:3853 length:894 start_codon:yes stop_codon:yes gene_type:complete
MAKYLIFRTDRIGDFLLSCILIRSIKRNDSNSHITVLASKKNFNYISSFTYIDKVLILKKGLINKLKTIFVLRKYFFDFSVLHDGKNRSKLINLFLKKKHSLYFNNKDISISHFEKIVKAVSDMGFDFKNYDLNILEEKLIKYSDIENSDDYAVLHYDEKWSNSDYIKNFVNIEPNKSELVYFLNQVQKLTNLKIIITTGINTPKIINDISNSFDKQNFSIKKNLNFLELEKIIINSKLLISCHGSVSHIASALSIKQVDIIDKSYHYNIWNKHFRNYNSIKRKDFKNLSKEICNIL